MSNRALRTSSHRGMIKTIHEYLLGGNRLSATDAYEMWKEMNLRNKVSALRAEGWPIHSEEADSTRGGKYKIYFLDMDEKFWPKNEETAS